MATVYFVRHAQPEFSWADVETGKTTKHIIVQNIK